MVTSQVQNLDLGIAVKTVEQGVCQEEEYPERKNISKMPSVLMEY
jgi:hypothetical protein